MATAIISGGRAFRTATPVFSIPQWSLFVGGAFAPNWRPDGNGHRFGRKSLQSATPVSSISPWSRLKPLLPIEIGLPGRYVLGVGLRRRKRHLPGRRRPTVGRRPLEAEFIRRRPTPDRRLLRRIGNRPSRALRAGRRPPPTQKTPPRSAQAFTPIGNRPSEALRAGRRPPPTQKTPSRSAQAFTPIEIGLPRRCAPGVGLRRRKRYLLGRRRPTAGRRPSCRLKSAFQGAARRASASVDAKDTSPVGAGRPSAEGPGRPNSFGVHADRRPKAFPPIEIGLPGRCAPGVGLRRRKRHLPGRRRPTAGRRPSCRLKSAFQGAARRASASADAKDTLPVGAGRPLAEGPWRPNSFGAGRPPTVGFCAELEIGLPGRCAPGVGLRRRKRHLPGRRRLSRRLEIGLLRRCAPGVGLRRRKRHLPGRRRPSRRLKSAFQGAARQASAFADAKDTFSVGAGRLLAEGLHAD
jgi:hypothetical protein